MTHNKRLFFELIGEPAEIQTVEDGREIKIYFMTPEQKQLYLANGRSTVWAFYKNEVKLLIDEEYYNYKTIKEFYNKEVNYEWLKFIDKSDRMRKVVTLPFFGGVLLLYIIITTLLLVVEPIKNALGSASLYVLAGLMLLVFLASWGFTKYAQKRNNQDADATQENIQKLLGDDLYNQIIADKAEYEREKEEAARKLAEEQTKEAETEEKPKEENLEVKDEKQEENK